MKRIRVGKHEKNVLHDDDDDGVTIPSVRATGNDEILFGGHFL